MSVEITIPFALDARGRISSVSNPNAQVRQHVMSLINTEPGERVVYGNYGVALSDMLFEDADEALAGDIRDQISQAFAEWEPGVLAREVTTQEVENYSGLVEALVGYHRVDAADSEAAPRNTNVVSIRAGGQVSEVIRS